MIFSSNSDTVVTLQIEQCFLLLLQIEISMENQKRFYRHGQLNYNFSTNNFPLIVAWSPCGTRITIDFAQLNIVVLDQQQGPLNNNGNCNRVIG